MKSHRSKLLSGTGLLLGATLAASGALAAASSETANPIAVSKPQAGLMQLAACKAACKACNPCAAKKACNPCAAKKKN